MSLAGSATFKGFDFSVRVIIWVERAASEFSTSWLPWLCCKSLTFHGHGISLFFRWWGSQLSFGVPHTCLTTMSALLPESLGLDYP